MKPMAVAAVVLMAAAMGCGESVPPPNDAWAAAQADLGRAQASGAPYEPQAKLHLRLAQEDLQKARELIGHDDRRATSLTELARVEAQLAITLANEAAARYGANRASTELQRTEDK
jgi:hypothetical protein